MPFTPFHLGPALGFGLSLRKWLHVPTFTLADVVLDIEPFLALVTGADYPLHGYLHTLVSALIVGFTVGYVMSLFQRFFQRAWRALRLEPVGSVGRVGFLAAGILGTVLHVVLDSPLYEEMRPFYPLTGNPLYDPSLMLNVYLLCVWPGIFGIGYYLFPVVAAAR